MTAALRDSSSATAGAAQTSAIAIAVPALAQAGDWGVWFIAGEDTTPVPTWATGWTDVTPAGASRANESMIVAIKQLVAGDLSTSPSTSFTTSKSRVSTMLVFSGVTGTIDVSIGDNWTGGTTATALGVTTTVADDAIVVCYAVQGATLRTFSTPTGFAVGPAAQSTNATSGNAMGAFYLADQGAAGATGNITSTYVTATNGVSITLTLEETGGTPATVAGVTATSTSAAPSDGTVNAGATIAGVTAASTSAAPAGSVLAAVNIIGVTATSTSSAPVGAVTVGGAANVIGITATSTSSAPAGSVSAGATIAGVAAAWQSVAPGGTVSITTTPAYGAGSIVAATGPGGRLAAVLAPSGDVDVVTAPKGVNLAVTAPTGRTH